MSDTTTPAIERAEEAIFGHDDSGESLAEDVRRGLAAALDDPDLGPRISAWRHTACEHSRVLNPREHAQGDEADYEQACSPCLRDRLRAWLLGGAS